MKTRHASAILLHNGKHAPRKTITHTCPICGDLFKGRFEAKACSPECTTQLRSISAKNRIKHS